MKSNDILKNAVITGDWSKIDPSKITLEDFLVLDNQGKSLIYNAKTHKTLHKFPKELIGENGIIWRHPIMMQYTLLGLVAEGKINMVPKDIITKRGLIEKNDQGSTLIHHIACFDSIKNIDQGLLTNKELMVKNNYDSTPLEVASQQLKKCLNSPISPRPHETTESIKRLKENINIILKNLELGDLNSKTWDQETLPYIKPELAKRKVLSKIAKKENSIGI